MKKCTAIERDNVARVRVRARRASRDDDGDDESGAVVVVVVVVVLDVVVGVVDLYRDVWVSNEYE